MTDPRELIIMRAGEDASSQEPQNRDAGPRAGVVVLSRLAAIGVVEAGYFSMQ
jgi:hypothetical protein